MQSKKIQHTISFILDNEIITVDFEKQELSPTLTVLNYLRSLPGHKGVKEGCAEGDCGACTVVVAELDNRENLVYSALNSCLVFLPQIHGKQLITVENLAQKNNGDVNLHPVQQALVEMNGSQCGYCTPGVTMSMFALYKDPDKPSNEKIKDAMTGNLCRCTGYRSILNAAEKACSNGKNDHFVEKQNQTIATLKKINSQNSSIQIITGSQKYFIPLTINEALELRRNYPAAVLVNGSTDVALKQTKKFELLPVIIDLSAISELKNYTISDNEIVIGSGMSLERVRTIFSEKLPALGEMISIFASKQIRNLATLGGNLGTASPIGDTIPLLMAYSAKVILADKNDKRELAIENFIRGYRKTDLKEDELIHSVVIPLEASRNVRFYKVSKRKDLDISSVSAGIGLELEKGIVKDIILAFGGMADMPKRAKKTESMLVGKAWKSENIEAASEILFDEYNPISDARCSAEFRKTAARNLLMKYFLEISAIYDQA